MSRSCLYIAASLLVLAACQPAADTADDLVVEVPPIVAEDVADTNVEEVAPLPEDVAPAETETVAAPAEDTPIEETASVADADNHEHDDHDDDAHEDHSEDDHDHDHDHDGAGEAHVHGLSELAASLDGSTLSVSLEGALANFGLDESIRELEDTAPYTDGLVAIIGGDCRQENAAASIRPIGDHGNLVVDLTYSCTSVDELEAIDVTGFASFSGMEQVDAVYLTDTDQVAAALTASASRLNLN
jgi:hypothetical protein